MIIATEAIVFSAIKYGEADLIATCFTKEEGVKSYLLKNVLKSKKSGIKASYFQPLTQLEIVANHKNKGTLEFLREVKIGIPYQSLHTNIIKGSLVMFLSEILKNCIREEEANFPLYNFISNSLIRLDRQDESANFHIHFLIELSRFLGFYPDTSQIEYPFFNLMDGRFQLQKTEPYCLEKSVSDNLKLFFSHSPETIKSLQFSKKDRSELLNGLLVYYQLHVQGYRKPKSLEVFQKLFN